MNQKTLKKGCCIGLAVYLILAVLFYWIGGDQFQYRDAQTDMLSMGEPIGEITKDQTVTQRISVSGDQLTGLNFLGATYARQNTGNLLIEVYSENELLGSASVDVSTLVDNSEFYVPFSPSISIPNHTAELRITAPEAVSGNAVTLYIGNTMSASRAEVQISISDEDLARVNETPRTGSLCLSVHSREILWFGEYYWCFVSAIFVLLIVFCVYLLVQNKRQKTSQFLNIFIAFSRYRYLIKQLVSRDFKTKYKRSVLGIFWSFFKSSLDNVGAICRFLYTV